VGGRGGRPAAATAGPAALLGVVAAILLVGCDFLTGSGSEGPSPSTLAVYSKGTATIAITSGETITLGEVVAGSSVSSAHGAEVRWTGPGGWNIRVSNVGVPNTYGSTGPNGGYLVLDRAVGGEQWTTRGDARCVIHINVVDAKAIRGTATCTEVAWYDASNQPFEAGQQPSLDEPKFDAEITFEAVP
jgi:hypothetical protein